MVTGVQLYIILCKCAVSSPLECFKLRGHLVQIYQYEIDDVLCDYVLQESQTRSRRSRVSVDERMHHPWKMTSMHASRSQVQLWKSPLHRCLLS